MHRTGISLTNWAFRTILGQLEEAKLRRNHFQHGCPHSYFIYTSEKNNYRALRHPQAQLGSFRRTFKLTLLGYWCRGNPSLAWRGLGSRCRATYTRHRCILGEQLRAGEDTACAALPLAEPQPSSKPFLLFHSRSPTRWPNPPSPPPPPPPPPPTHHTRSACLSGCPHASLPGAAGTLAVTPHHSTCTAVAPLRVRVCAGRAHWSNGTAVHARAKARVHLGAGMPNAARAREGFCVSVSTCTFLGQCVLIRAD